ncbi:MAG: hypothetical protein OXU51_10795 [Candidatus Poribacteria bacterium]|nr:hypothetical protein [Candidatus Poribacteria bacterium]
MITHFLIHLINISILIFLTCFLSLSFFYSCGDTEDANLPDLITKTEGYTFTDTLTDTLDETWIRVSDDYIAELMELELPPNFESIEDPELRKKYHHMLILKQFGDIPQVRTVIEYELNLPNPHPNPYTVRLIPGDKESIAHLERRIIYLEAMVFLWPLEGTQKALEHTKKLKQRFSVDMDKLMKEDPELFVQIQRDHLIESFGDIPEVHTYTKILLKLMLEEPITDEERGAYLKGMNHLFTQQ